MTLNFMSTYKTFSWSKYFDIIIQMYKTFYLCFKSLTYICLQISLFIESDRCKVCLIRKNFFYHVPRIWAWLHYYTLIKQINAKLSFSGFSIFLYFLPFHNRCQLCIKLIMTYWRFPTRIMLIR